MFEDTPRRPIRRVFSTMKVLDGNATNWPDGKTYRAEYKKLVESERKWSLELADPIVKCWIKQAELKQKKDTMSDEEYKEQYKEQEEKLAREYSDAKAARVNASKQALGGKPGSRPYPFTQPKMVWDGAKWTKKEWARHWVSVLCTALQKFKNKPKKKPQILLFICEPLKSQRGPGPIL